MIKTITHCFWCYDDITVYLSCSMCFIIIKTIGKFRKSINHSSDYFENSFFRSEDCLSNAQPDQNLQRLFWRRHWAQKYWLPGTFAITQRGRGFYSRDLQLYSEPKSKKSLKVTNFHGINKTFSFRTARYRKLRK